MFKERRNKRKINKILSVSISAIYKGQDMRWTEQMRDWGKAEKDIILYHYSDRQVKSFYPKVTAFFPEKVMYGDDRKEGKRIGEEFVYAIKIKKNRLMSRSVAEDEIRIELNENDELQYLGKVEKYFVKINDLRFVDKTKDYKEKLAIGQSYCYY